MRTPTLRRGGSQTLPRLQPLSLILLPLLLFTLFPTLAQDDSTVLYPGTYQAEDGRITLPDDAQIVDAEGAEFGQAVSTQQIEIKAYGTGVKIRWQSGSILLITDLIENPNPTFAIDADYEPPRVFLIENPPILVGRSRYSRLLDQNLPLLSDSISILNQTLEDGEWKSAYIGRSLLPRLYNIQISAVDSSDLYARSRSVGEEYEKINFTIDSITVADRTFQNVAPLAAGVLIFAGMLAYVVVSSLRARWAK